MIRPHWHTIPGYRPTSHWTTEVHRCFFLSNFFCLPLPRLVALPDDDHALLRQVTWTTVQGYLDGLHTHA